MRWSGERTEIVMGTLLRVGVLLAAAIVLTGGVYYLAHAASGRPAFGTFRGEPEDLRGPAEVLRGTLALRYRDVIQFGLLVLILTPVARVIFAVIAFALEGDRTYTVIALAVLGILLYSLAGGGG